MFFDCLQQSVELLAKICMILKFFIFDLIGGGIDLIPANIAANLRI